MSELKNCPSTISKEDIAAYRSDGYLAFANVLSPDEVAAAATALSELARKMSRRADRRQVGNMWLAPDSPLAIEFEEGYVPDHPTDVDLDTKVRKYMWFAKSHSTLNAMANRHPKISALARALLGGRPLLMQDMALVKPPFIGREKPWHQDDAYFAVVPLDAVVGVWIALDDAAPENGCMHVIPGGHLPGPRRHQHISDCEIPIGDLPQMPVVPVPLPPGGALFFSGLLPHQTPPNTSSMRRRALQFHYRSSKSRTVSRDEYDAIFIDANGPASCAAAAK